MAFSYRVAAPADLERCRDLVAEHRPDLYDEDLRAALPELWQTLLDDRAIEMHVFEDDALPQRDRIFGFASGVVLHEDAVAFLLDDPPPRVSNRLCRDALAGHPRFLGESDVRGANSLEGVDAFGLDMVVAPVRWRDPASWSLLPMLIDSLEQGLAGYRLRSAMREIHGTTLRRIIGASGWRVLSDFRSHLGRDRVRIPAVKRPYLVGLTRAQAHRFPSLAARYFSWQPPRFGFSPMEQQVLLRALRGATDEGIAADLDISINTLKMHWRSIFARVEEADPEPRRLATPARSVRGRERRRHLLAYLRQHMEELRPHRRRS